MRKLFIFLSILFSLNVSSQPEYHISIGLNHSDFYGYSDVDRLVYREFQSTFAEKVSMRFGVELNGDITGLLSYRSGLIYKGSGTTGYDMDVLSMPILLLMRSGGAKFGAGISPSIMLNQPSINSNQYHYPVHLLASFKLLNKFQITVGHLRHLSSILSINAMNLDSPREVPDVNMNMFETYLSVSYQLF